MSERDIGELFMKYDYAEVKDLCKHFLTLVSSILVFSIAFSEKIINYQEASTKAKLLLLSSWVLFALAIISCGLALCYLAFAGGQAVYGQGNYYPDCAFTSYQLIITAGILAEM